MRCRRSRRISPRAARSPRRCRSPSARSSSTMGTPIATTQLAALFERAKKLPEHERVSAQLAELLSAARRRGPRARDPRALRHVGELQRRLGGRGRARRPRRAQRRRTARRRSRMRPVRRRVPGHDGCARAPDRLRQRARDRRRARRSRAPPRQSQRVAEATQLVAHAGRGAAARGRAREQAALAPDWEALLAEASVYLRYGKRDKAIAHLQRVVDANPNHRGALEKLGEALRRERRAREARWRSGCAPALRAHEERDSEALRVLRGRIAVLDESAAAHIPGATCARLPRRRRASAHPRLLRGAPSRRARRSRCSSDDELLEDELSLDGDERSRSGSRRRRARSSSRRSPAFERRVGRVRRSSSNRTSPQVELASEGPSSTTRDRSRRRGDVDAAGPAPIGETLRGLRRNSRCSTTSRRPTSTCSRGCTTRPS